ncbi:hypothetical protein CAPTEDRAFT_229185 [Capitella teleta]|uniref:E3 SUMO-protein ligase RanBP2 n=1 Tax=Capitella teleta TaxID=283909 RepID=R7TZ80_CAPTE|nr:hypothetical protein CAPTEDRAFT_229185 [Capitella teleta]|eukprot:ELT98927.1 hypothetical protein CAPTEDRAFT_229185 [Capitella teleta]
MQLSVKMNLPVMRRDLISDHTPQTTTGLSDCASAEFDECVELLVDYNHRNAKGYSFAKLYYDVKAFEKAKRYLEGFLLSKDNYAPAHKLMGQINEAMQSPDNALAAYKRSLELDDKQKDVLVKVCELCCHQDIDPERARYWAERGSSLLKDHPVVFKLKEKICSQRNGKESKEDLEHLISAQLVKQPRNPELRIKLLQLLLETGRVNEAYEHAVEVERRGTHVHCLNWYRTVLRVFTEYKVRSGKQVNGTFHRWLLTVLNQMVSLSLEQASIPDSTDVLKRFDAMLQLCEKFIDDDMWRSLHKEMQAQLFYHSGTLLLKKALHGKNSWKEASIMSGACYAVSYSIKPFNKQDAWFALASTEDRHVFERWYESACTRAAQVGHLVRCLAGSDPQDWLQRIEEAYLIPEVQDRLFSALFSSPDVKHDKETSFLVQNSVFANTRVDMPMLDDLALFEQVAVLSAPSSLNAIVWFTLQHYSNPDAAQPDYGVSLFSNLTFDFPNLDHTVPESLSYLDTQAFLYLVTRNALLKARQADTFDRDRPMHLPLSLNCSLCSSEQADWWKSAFMLCSNATAGADLGLLRRTLQRGLEVVRLIGNHGLSLAMIIHLARTFERRGKAKQDSEEEGDLLNARAYHYWKSALSLIDRWKRQRKVWAPKDRLFADLDGELCDEDLRVAEREGHSFLARRALSAGRFPEALGAFEKVDSPTAAYEQAKIYYELSCQKADADGLSSQEKAYLEKTKECLFLSLDRMRGSHHHPLSTDVSDLLDCTETRLAGCDASAFSIQDVSQVIQSTPRAVYSEGPRRNLNLDDTPPVKNRSPVHLRPSPERLDAHLRSLSVSQDAIMDEVQSVKKSIQGLVDKMSALEILIKTQPPVAAAAPPVAPVMLPAFYPPPRPEYEFLSPYGPQYAGYPPMAGAPPRPPFQQPPYRAPAPPPAKEPDHYADLDYYGDGEGYDDQTDDFTGPPIPGPGFFADKGGVAPSIDQLGMLVAGSPVSPAVMVPVGPSLVAGTGTGILPTPPSAAAVAAASGKPVTNFQIPMPAASKSEAAAIATKTPAASMLKDMAKKSEEAKTFGGFTFSGQPVIQESPVKQPGAPAKEEAAVAAPKPFANFNFGATKASPVAPVFTPPKPVAVTPTKTTPKANLSIGASPDHPYDAEFEPDVDFKPIVRLPDVVDLKTGEEDEQKMFGARCRLFRMDGETKAWKERGIGEIKILKNKESSKCRVVMRRDQVLKLCANHLITPEQELKPMANETKAVCWYAQDYSEEEVSHEHLAARFKSDDICARFKQVFEQCQKNIPVTPKKPAKVEEPKTLAQKFQEQNKGKWCCDVCYVHNDEAVKKCVACETLRPGCTPEPPAPASSAAPLGGIAPGGGFSFGAGGGMSFGSKAAEEKTEAGAADASKGGFSFGGVKVESKPLFGNVAASSSPAVSSATTKSASPFAGFSFGAAKPAAAPSNATPTSTTGNKEPTISLGAKPSIPAPQSNTTDNKEPTLLSGAKPSAPQTDADKSSFVFGSATSATAAEQKAPGAFTFTLTPAKAASTQPADPQSPDGDGLYKDDEDDSHITFEPIVKLPDNVDIVTGEEDEEVLYEHRALLYRFVNAEWKERGKGNIKILRNATTGKLRMLMRREQVLKICLNHYITDAITLSPMPNAQGKAWTWHADDFADAEPSHESFAIRFKNQEIALGFKEAFDNSRESSAKMPVKKTEVKKASPEKQALKAPSVEASPAVAPIAPSKFSFGGTANVFGGTPSNTASDANSKAKFSFRGSTFGASSAVSFSTTPKTENKSVFNQMPSATTNTSPMTKGVTPKTSLLTNLLTSDVGAVDLTDVQIVHEEVPTAELVAEAKKFQLPKTFFNYLNAKPCSGCIGCDSDNFDFSQIKPNLSKSTTPVTPAPVAAPAEVKPKEPAPPTALKSTGIMFSPKPGGLDFAALASKSDTGFSFGKGSTDFKWSGAGSSIFGAPSTSPEKNTADDADAADTVEEFEPDVHFEPLVKLAEVTDLKTGEEGETVLFSQRSRLYRFDGASSQWKERGVGEIKILKNEELGRFRLLMRREQVLKVACNHYITEEMSLQPMATSETAWCWFAVDYAEGEAKNEQLAVKLKTKDLAQQFKDVFTQCQKEIGSGVKEEIVERALSVKPAAITGGGGGNPYYSEQLGTRSAVKEEIVEAAVSIKPAVVTGGGGGNPSYSKLLGKFAHLLLKFPYPYFHLLFPPSGATSKPPQAQASADVESIGPKDNDDDYETEEDYGTQLFGKRCTLYFALNGSDSFESLEMGELQIYYDHEQKYKVFMEDSEGMVVCDHAIETNCTSERKKKQVEWDGENATVDPPIRVRYRASFSSEQAAQEFLNLVNEGVDIAAQAPAAEEYSDDEEEEPLYNRPASLTYLLANGNTEVKGSGDLLVRFDEDVLGYRIMMEKVISVEDGDSVVLINHIICRDHRIIRLGQSNSVQWTAMDFATDEAVRRTFRVTFDAFENLVEFEQIFAEGVTSAREMEIDELKDGGHLTQRIHIPEVAGRIVEDDGASSV